MVASPTAFTAEERQALSDRFERDGFDWVFHVKLQEADSNRFNRLPDTSLYQAFQAVVRGDPIPGNLGARHRRPPLLLPLLRLDPLARSPVDHRTNLAAVRRRGLPGARPAGGGRHRRGRPHHDRAAHGAAVAAAQAAVGDASPWLRRRRWRCLHRNPDRAPAAPDPGSRRPYRRLCHRHRRHAGLGRPRQPIVALVATRRRTRPPAWPP